MPHSAIRKANMHPYNEQLPPIIMDIEASGFGNDSYPIEIGFIDSIGERFCNLITPQEDWDHWSFSAETAHGISRDLLLKKGHPAWDVAKTLNRLLQDKTVYSDGWVVDHPWLMRLFYSVNLAPTFQISPIEMVMNEFQIEIWDATRNQVLQDSQLQRHRASSDALIIQRTWIDTYRQCQQIAPQKNQRRQNASG